MSPKKHNFYSVKMSPLTYKYCF